MNMKPPLQWVAAIGLFLAFPISSRGQNWILTSAPMEQWSSMSSSANGSNLIATAHGGVVYLSHDSGATWSLADLPSGYWAITTSSADGTKLVVAASEGGICTSDDSGATWRSNNVPNEAWAAVAASADGTKLYAAAYSEYQDSTDPPAGIFASTNSGGTWVLTAAPLRNWGSIACSADGTKLIAADEGLKAAPDFSTPSCLWVSTNSGATFQVERSIDVGWWISVACSSDGNTVVAAHSTGLLLTSKDGGGSWRRNAVSVTGAEFAWGVACSADGRRMAVQWVVGAGQISSGSIYVSTDSGVSWIQAPLPAIGSQSVFWNCFCVSADGCRLAGAPVPSMFSLGGVFTLQTTPSPALTVAHPGGNLVLTWVVPSASFALEHSSDIGAANWTDVPGAPVLNYSTLREEVTVPSSGRRMFYRLVSRP
jgi:photosystem II stability/assembly factor-like uncharacterized protein